MFNFKKTIEPTHLEKVIERLLSRLDDEDPTKKEYSDIADQVVKLQKAQEAATASRRRISPDALLAAGVSILTVILILNYERLNPITSKALGFLRLR